MSASLGPGLPLTCEELNGEAGHGFCFRSSQERPGLGRQGYLWKSVSGKNKKESLLFLEILCFSGDKRAHKRDAHQPVNGSLPFLPTGPSWILSLPNSVGPSYMNFENVLCYMLPDCFAEELHHFLFLLVVDGGPANISLCHHLLQFSSHSCDNLHLHVMIS